MPLKSRWRRSKLAFALACWLAFGRLILRSRRWHNAPPCCLLALLGACQALNPGGLQLADDSLQRRGVLAALVVAALMAIIGGRVIPLHRTRAGTGPARRRRPWLMWSLLGGSLAIP